MKRAAAFGVIFGVVALNAGAASLLGDAKAGAEKAAACVACHGMDGNSPSPEWPKLAGQTAAYTARQLALFKDGQRDNPVMLGFAAALSEQDMADLGAHYAELPVKPGLADESLVTVDGPWKDQPAYAVGQRIYRGGLADRGIPACTACHGIAGQGVPVTGYPALAGQHADYTKAKLQWFRDGHGFAGDLNGKVMPEVARGLTDVEIEALATYLEGLARR